jgi:predicted O-linked N-acetylglucosamine transferase (SPINDLY family)
MASIGKNDPCPCGSGLKYKQCCANRMVFEKLIVDSVEKAYQNYLADKAETMPEILLPVLSNANDSDLNKIESYAKKSENDGFIIHILNVLKDCNPELFMEKFAYSLYNKGLYSIAIPYLTIVAEKKSDDFLINLSLITALNKVKNFDEALRHSEKIIDDNPGEERAYLLKLESLNQSNNLELFEIYINEVKKILPDSLLIYNKHSSVYFVKGDFEMAEQKVSETLLKWPEDISLLNMKAVCLIKLQREIEALEVLDAMPIHDNKNEKLMSLQTRQSIAYRFSNKKDFFESIDKQIELNPDFEISGKFKKATFFPHVIPSEESIKDLRDESMLILNDIISNPKNIDDPFLQVNLANFYLAYHGCNDKEMQLMFASAYYKCCSQLGAYATHCSQLPPLHIRKIKIGLISAFFKLHTIGKFNIGFIEKLPRNLFEIIVFTMENLPKDNITEKIVEFADKVIVLPRNLEISQEMIAKEEIDVLFYTDIGMDPLTYYLAFARLAPVQCVTWGHPDTTGLPNIDYFISADDVEPADADNHYSEKLIRLSNLPTYYYKPTIPEPGDFKANYFLPEDKKIYTCPQSIFKFHPHFDEALGQLLIRDENAVLVIIGGGNAEWFEPLTDRISKKIPSALLPRIFVLPKMPMDDYFKLLQVSDVILDPPYFGGGNTSYESFACGKGIVTWPGPFMRGRVTLGCYRQMEIDDLIANNADEYLQLAYRMANDEEFKKNIEEKIIEKRDILFENQAVIDEISDFFTAAYIAALEHKKLDFWRWKNED